MASGDYGEGGQRVFSENLDTLASVANVVQALQSEDVCMDAQDIVLSRKRQAAEEKITPEKRSTSAVASSLGKSHVFTRNDVTTASSQESSGCLETNCNSERSTADRSMDENRQDTNTTNCAQLTNNANWEGNNRANTQNERPLNFYKRTDRGPYVVHMECMDRNIGRLHPMALGKLLHISLPEIKQDILNISSMGKTKVKVELKSPEKANFLVTSELLKTKKIEAYIPSFVVHKMGVIRHVEINLDEAEILEVIQSPFPVIGVRRFMKNYGKDQLAKLQTCLLTFDSQVLPEAVSIHGARCSVEPYVPSVRQCFNCLRYGHISKQCRSQTRCGKCGGPHSMATCSSPIIICIHCRGQHQTTDRSCPEYRIRRRAQDLATFNNIDIQEALSIARQPSYAAIAGGHQDIRVAPSTDAQTDLNVLDAQNSKFWPPLSDKNMQGQQRGCGDRSHQEVVPRKIITTFRTPRQQVGVNKHNNVHEWSQYHSLLYPMQHAPTPIIQNPYQPSTLRTEVSQTLNHGQPPVHTELIDKIINVIGIVMENMKQNSIMKESDIRQLVSGIF